jgi:hypothetical protein
MTPKFDEVISRLKSLIAKSDDLLSKQHEEPFYSKPKEKIFIVDPFGFVKFSTASLHFIETTLGKETQYYVEFSRKCQSNSPHHVKVGKALLEGLLEEFESRWLWSTRGIVTAEIYADFLEMAEGLLDAKYKDAAAVMIGGVLEEHLRRLCAKHGVVSTFEKDGKLVPKKADAMNSALASAEVYNKLDQKWVTTALDLRNKAAHGLYGEYSEDQVRSILLQSTTNFLQRQPI